MSPKNVTIVTGQGPDIAMEMNKQQPKKGNSDPNPLLFYIMLGIIVASIVIFMSLNATHTGQSSKGLTSTPSSRK